MRASPADDSPLFLVQPTVDDRATLLPLRARVASCWQQVSSIEPPSYDYARPEIVTRFRVVIEQALSEVIELCRALMDHCDRRVAREGNRGGHTPPALREHRVLSDVCFMAVTETCSKLREVSVLTQDTNPMHALSRCGSALRRARRALTSVDLQLASVLGEAPSIDMSDRLQESLEVRKAYSILRRTAEGSAAPQPADLQTRLRAIELRMSLLTEKALFKRLRVDDQQQLASLRERLQTWLTEHGDEVSGMRLWQDAVGFTQLLNQVNIRQELREHDSAIVQTVLARIEVTPAPLVDDSIWSSLRQLLGLDDQLDDLLRLNQRERATLLPALRAVADMLQPSSTFSIPNFG